MQARDFFDEPQPASSEPRRETAPEPARTQFVERRDETPLPTPAPAPAVHAAPVVFNAVSEHDTVVEQAHRPVRRRRHGQVDGEAAPAPLQIVETQAEAPAVIAVDDEVPRRTRPRKRRGGEVASEPLKLVETQPGAEGAQADNQP
jgi:pyruvate/2-oxoglutarate dehydrogenase complex dihydrolipoamide acyltransferase (E2) component